jgi:ribonuclease HI
MGSGTMSETRRSQFLTVTGQVIGRKPVGQLIAATDASLKPGRRAGLGFVVADGRWGAGRQDWPRYTVAGRITTEVLELRAIALLLLRQDDSPDVIRCDSLSAIRLMKAWQSGDVTQMPDGYGVGPRGKGAPTLVRLARKVADIGDRLSVVKVAGHTGDLLNECADSLAKIGRDAADKTEMQQRAERLVSGFLDVWHRTS